MRIGLINIGDELLVGKILNTNAFDLASWAGELGHELVFNWVIGDDLETIAQALRDAAEGKGGPRCEYLFLTGGLGPTQDDVTREAVTAFQGVPLEFNSEAEGWLAERLKVAREAISLGQRQQLYVPKGTRAFRNPAGSACGFGFQTAGMRVFAFPGVPSEFRAMFDAHCRKELQRRDSVLLRKRLITFGLSESRQRELLKDFSLPQPFRFSSLPNEPGVAIAVEAFVKNEDATEQEARLQAAWEELLSRLPPESIVDKNGSGLPETVFTLLRDKRRTVSIAESCTAGALGYLLTEAPGSSAVFKRGFLTYSNEAKTDLLRVPHDLLAEHGAVSGQVALAMARGCQATSKADYGVAITGIAGPDGGTPEKPVGLVFISVASGTRAEIHRFQFRGDRKSIRWQSAYTALNQLRLFIIKDL